MISQNKLSQSLGNLWLLLSQRSIGRFPDGTKSLPLPWQNDQLTEQQREKGSSTTRSAPFSKAIWARVHLSTMAGSPRWTKFPDMATIFTPSACSSRYLCPLWKGLNSAIIPVTIMPSYFCATKNQRLLVFVGSLSSKSAYNLKDLKPACSNKMS